MPADDLFPDASAFAERLRKLRIKRRTRVASARNERARRAALTKAEREEVFRKTAGRCHICGGEITEIDWQADHVLAHSTGGKDTVDNYLPAHSICNNYRWHYDSEELQWIIKLGVWIRHEIERETSIGIVAGKNFYAYENHRDGRRRSRAEPPQTLTVVPQSKVPTEADATHYAGGS